MKQKQGEKGFSLIELLIVVVIVGIIAAVSVPAYQKATKAAENASAFSMMRTLHSHETTYFSQHGRFGRLDEIYPQLSGQGTLVVDKIVRGKHTYEMAPATDTQLQGGFTIQASRNFNDTLLERYEIDASGVIQRLFP